MTNRYEQRYLIDLAFRVVQSFSARSLVAVELSSWVEDQDLGFAWEPDVDNFRKKGIPTALWSELQRLLVDRNATVKRQKPDLLAKNISLLADHVGLNSSEHRIFELAIRASRTGPVRSLCNGLIIDARLPVLDAVQHLSGLSASCVQRALTPSGRLLASSLLQIEKTSPNWYRFLSKRPSSFGFGSAFPKPYGYYGHAFCSSWDNVGCLEGFRASRRWA